MHKIPKTKPPKIGLPSYDRERTFKIDDASLVFGFKYFHGESIKIGEFNNYHKNCFEAISAMRDFHEAIANLSKMCVKEAFSASNKRQLHLHSVTNNEADRIDKILLEGYNFPEKLVEEFREGQYYQFSFSDGQRAISIKHDFIVELLFLDPNHLIYSASSRSYKEKLNYSSPSILSKDAEASIINEFR